MKLLKKINSDDNGLIGIILILIILLIIIILAYYGINFILDTIIGGT